MYAPHTVTVYNVMETTDKETFETVTEVNATVLRGVFLQASKGANVRDTGLVGADAATLYIPFSVDATDGTTGASKRYVGAREYWAAADRSGLWTLSYDGNGGTTVFVKGEFISDKLSVVRLQDGCYDVTKVDEMDYGSPELRHFEVGGI